MDSNASFFNSFALFVFFVVKNMKVSNIVWEKEHVAIVRI
jgi:hypothetical protein